MDIEIVRRDVDKYLRDFFAQRITRGTLIDAGVGEFWEVLRDVTFAGGKRLRPYLLVAAYIAYGGTSYEDIVPIAAAQELLHGSLLVHDDIIDKDFIRHGQDNISGVMREKYRAIFDEPDAVYYANSAALLGGDLLLAAAHELVAASMLSDDFKVLVLREIGEVLFHVGAGQLLDMESVLRPYDAINPLQIADLKTARYSFVAPLRIGARLAGVLDSEADRVAAFGAALGVAYQLTDDVLGIFGDEVVTGKSTMSDIREGKRTYLMSCTLRRASDSERKVLQAALGNASLTRRQAARVKTIIISSGADAEVAAAIDLYASQAATALDGLTLELQGKLRLRALIAMASKRVQ